MSVFSTQLVAQALTYKAYQELSQQLFQQHKTTSDDPYFNEDWVLEITKLNLQRISRLDKSASINEKLTFLLQNLPRKQIWLVLVESWCGDVAQNLPAIHKMAETAAGKVELKLLLRDKNPAVMNAYLTNGGKSIPKLIALDAETLQELGTWGPRPEPVQALMLENKAANLSFEASHQIIHGWYAKDKNKTLQEEFMNLVEKWSSF
ncbi:MAG: thioredoxin family protein [Verrucomicrobia bacterium]|nr:thioredoxin family protein [Cytophagales bacterium]